MARLALGAVGATAGFFIGGPTGALVGFNVGATAGTLLFPEDGPVIEGPRLGDLDVSSSTYGKPIPLVYGTLRIGGNMIWAKDPALEEVRSEEEVGGKGGGSSSTRVPYSYYSTFAMGFCQTEVEGLLKIWADSKLIYDATQTPIVKKDGLTFRFYKGTETQTADSIIEAEDGTGEVPAYRGLCYIVFDHLPLADYSNRIPNITVEITTDLTTTSTLAFSDEYTQAEGGVLDGYQSDTLCVDGKHRRAYLYDSGAAAGIRAYDLDTMVEVQQALEADIASDGTSLGIVEGGFAADEGGYLYGQIGGGNGRPIIKIDPDTLTEVGRFGASTSSTNFSATSWQAMQSMTLFSGVAGVSGAGRRKFLLGRGVISDKWGILDATNMTHLFGDNDNDYIPSPNSMGPGLPEGSKAVAWVNDHDIATGNGDISIYKISIDNGASYDSDTGETYGVSVTLADTITSSTWGDDGKDNERRKGPYLDETDGGLIFMVHSDTSGCYVIKWVEGSGVVWTTYTTVAGDMVANSHEVSPQQSRITDSMFAWTDAGGNAAIIDTRDGSVLTSVDITTLGTSFSPGITIFDGYSQGIVGIVSSGGDGNLYKAQLYALSGGTKTLSDIVSDLSLRTGLTAADIDVTELTDEVRGYAVTRQMSARAAIEPLASAFFFDGVESDHKARFVKKASASLATVNQADLVVIDDETGEVLNETRRQEVELPERVSVVYTDPATDYQQGTQSTKRVRQPSSAMYSDSESSAQIPVVLSSGEARQISEKLLFSAWNERISNKWRGAPELLVYDPSDVLTLSMDSGTAISTRLGKLTFNNDFSVDVDGVTFDSAMLSSDSASSGALGVPQKLPPGSKDTKLFLLDIPLLRDTDDARALASVVYCAMSGYLSSWPGGSLYQSTDGGVLYEPLIKVQSAVTYGFVRNKLPDTDTPFQTDADTQLEVSIRSGSLSSVTQTQFLNDSNVALVGDPSTGNWEVVLFKNATLEQGGLYTVDTIIRGRRGTDINVGSHNNGEAFIVLSTTTIEKFALTTAQIDQSYLYKGVAFGRSPEAELANSFTGTGADLKPYAPVHLDAVEDGGNNIDISWVRRTRLGGELRDGTGTVPLAEDSESYEIDIKDGPAGSVLRTLTSSTISVQYDNADIITDFGSVPANLTYSVYQMSATVGRGFEREETTAI